MSGRAIHLQVTAANDGDTSTTIQNLRTQTDEDREAVIDSMVAAKEGTSELASASPFETRAMWAYGKH